MIRSRLAPFLLVLALSAVGCGDDSPSAGPDPTPTEPPVIESFLAEDPILDHGDFTALRWRIDGAEVAAISRSEPSIPSIGEITSLETGATTIRPHRDVTYTLTATNDFGQVTADVTVTIDYGAALYVDGASGTDAPENGGSLDTPLATIGAAVERTPAGGVILVTAGLYPENVDIELAYRQILGGRDPDTFFESDATTRLAPPAGVPITLTNTGLATAYLESLEFIAPGDAAYAARFTDATVTVTGCTFDGRFTTTGTGALVAGASNAVLTGCVIRGGRRAPSPPTVRGLEITGTTRALVSNCFIDGGRATNEASGVDIASTAVGTSTVPAVRLGLNTIGAEIADSGPGLNAAAVRIRAGATPAIGGNILFTDGIGQGHAVIESAPDADPSYFEGNLVASVDSPVYLNHPSDQDTGTDGIELGDPLNQQQLNDWQWVNSTLYGSNGGSVGFTSVRANLLVTGISARSMFENPDLVDYHLINPTTSGAANPALNQGNSALQSERYGFSFDDFDGDARPAFADDYDLGADELNR